MTSESDTETPREIRFGHMTQWRARLENDEVRIVRQKRKHTFGQGTSDHGPELTEWRGSIREAEQLHAMLDKLLRPEAYPHEVNYADE